MGKGKEKSDEYKGGYGQCRADALMFLNQALLYCQYGLKECQKWDRADKAAELKVRIETLRWLRSGIKSLKK